MLGAKKGIVRRLTNIRMKLRPSSWVSFAWRCLFFVCVALFHSGSNRTEQRNWKINQFEAGNLYKLGSRWMTLVASGIESTAAAASAKKKGKKKEVVVARPCVDLLDATASAQLFVPCRQVFKNDTRHWRRLFFFLFSCIYSYHSLKRNAMREREREFHLCPSSSSFLEESSDNSLKNWSTAAAAGQLIYINKQVDIRSMMTTHTHRERGASGGIAKDRKKE